MENIFYSIIKADCQGISSSLNENGLLEFMIPKDCTDEEFSKYLCSLGAEECGKIADKQKKTKKVFRKKVDIMIDKYKKEFDIKLMINLRLQNKTKKLNDYNVQVQGIEIYGNLSVSSILQYFPDELVETIIRGSVYMIACKYEELCSQIKGVSVGVFQFPDEEIKNGTYQIQEEAKYHISVPYSEIEKIMADYKAACNQLFEDLKKRPINYI